MTARDEGVERLRRDRAGRADGRALARLITCVLVKVTTPLSPGCPSPCPSNCRPSASRTCEAMIVSFIIWLGTLPRGVSDTVFVAGL